MKVILNELPDIVKETQMIQDLIEYGETEMVFDDIFVLNKDIIVNGEVKLRNIDDLENFINVANFFDCKIPHSVYRFAQTCEIGPKDPNIFENKKLRDKRNKKRKDFFDKFNKDIPLVKSLSFLLYNSEKIRMSNKYNYKNMITILHFISKYNDINFYLYLKATSYKMIRSFYSYDEIQHKVLTSAMKYKRFELISHLLRGEFDMKHVMMDIIHPNNFDMLKYLFEEKLVDKKYLQDLLDYIGTDDSIDIFRFLMDNGANIFTKNIKNFILNNCLEILKILYNKYNFQFESFHYFTDYEDSLTYDIETFKFLAENGAKITRNVYCFIISNDKFDIFKYAIEHTIVYDTDICACAAYFGRLEYLKILREKNVPWNAKTLACAMRNIHYNCVKWAMENGCEWNENIRRMFYIDDRKGEIKWY